jgi:hypothetical protein
MALKIHANTRGIAHKGSGQTLAPSPVDVCKTPTPGGPIPIPYANMIDAQAEAGDEGARKKQKQIKEESGAESATQGAIRSRGNEAGTVSGIMSSKIMGPSDYLLYSFDVKLEGKNVRRSVDPLLRNR